MSTIMKRMSALLIALVIALVGLGATAAYADTSKYAKSLELTGLSSGETVQVYKLMSYGSDYNTYTYDNTTTDGKTSFKAYLEAAATADSKSSDDYLAGLTGDELSAFLGTYLYGTDTYAKPTPTETAVIGTTASLTLEPGYYLISVKTTGTESNVYKPFSAFVKMNGESSAIKAGAGDWGTATVAMKSTNGPTIEKTVKRDNGTDMTSAWKSTKTVAVGETATYRVKLTVPDWQAGTTPRLELEDALVNQQYNGDIALYSAQGDAGSDWMPSTRIESAISEKAIGAYANGKQEVSFSIDYSKLTGGQTYYITYSAKVMSDITGTSSTGDMKATNTAKVVYSTSDATTSSTTESKTTLYTYSAKLTKKDMDNQLLPGSGFTVYSDEACTQAIKFEKVTNVDGSWYYRAKDTGDVTEIQADGDEASLLIKGLDPYKDYYFKETTTPKGYYAPSNAFKLDLDSQMKDGDATEHSGTLSGASSVTALDTASDGKLVSGNVDNDAANQFDIVIKNSSTPSLPTTGGMGTLLFTVAGLALMVIAAAVYFARRRKSN
ncbi:MAG: isopeptide-forming domain-containing fimbrial protein [Coriobacteriia bacterium]|nr:isopeptide-forming domain-containing fimbrial protein [Coriobacteriia bacterium]